MGTAAAEGGGKVEEEELEDLVEKGRAWVLALAAAVVAAARRFFDWVVSGDWMSWWPFWRPDRRLQRLIDDADANPADPAKQSALLHELNKFRCAPRRVVVYCLSFFMLSKLKWELQWGIGENAIWIG